MSTKFRNGTTDHTLIPRGCKPCERPKCSCCDKINETQTFKSTSNNKTFTTFHSVDYQSSWVIYIIECNICRLQYIGKSETGFNLRLNNHGNHIKNEVNSCELTEHFLHNVRSHNFENDVTITVIEQIRKGHLTILGFHQLCDQNLNRNHSMNKVKNLRYNR